MLTHQSRHRQARLTSDVRQKMSARLDPSKIPVALRGLIPLAEQFGMCDDLDRERLITLTPEKQRHELKTAIAGLEEDLDDWLAGPESAGPEYTNEYIAFSAMRMAADYS